MKIIILDDSMYDVNIVNVVSPTSVFLPESYTLYTRVIQKVSTVSL
jgi:hypothetical protein